tara:strand:+ start:2154 stop:2306 length:153 start_codon:yes stop_codon:yes gene_type:complete
MTKQIKIICAWCKTTVREGDTPMILGKRSASHGICLPCKEKFFEEVKNEN